MLGFVILGMGDILGNAPTFDEAPHLASGWTYWVTWDSRLNPEHPPLLKMIAAAPLLSMPVWPAGLRNDGSAAFGSLNEMWRAAPASFAQWFFADRWLYAVRDPALQSVTTEIVPPQAYLNNPDAMYLRARTVLLLFTGVGLGILILLWSKQLWGWWGASVSTALFSFDPNFIAHCGLVTTDGGITMLMFGTVFFLWRLRRTGKVADGIGFAVFFALAALAKFSAPLLLPITLVLIGFSGRRHWLRLGLAFAGAILFTFVAIWAAYGFRFEGSAGPMPLQKTVQEWYAKKELRKRFPQNIPDGEMRKARPPERIGWLGRSVVFAQRHRLLPEPFLYGFAHVQSGAVLRQTYLHGVFSSRGFRSFFLWTFLYKTPLPTIIAILVGLFLALRRRGTDRIFLLAPALLYLFTSLAGNLHMGQRHLLPMYPFLYVLCGALSRRWLIAAFLAGLSCLVVFAPFQPMLGQHLAYFNELAGGPTRGSKLLLDSNLDWGQDLKRLARWLREQEIQEPINLVYFGAADPSYYGIRYVNLEGGFYGAPEVPLSAARIPGWFAISANDYAGISFKESSRDRYRRFLDEHGARRVGRAGYSILIFRIE